ncbi:hypothetical protein JQX13_27610 [Archangium violaceum]|uniref:carboxypeptidase regulatory-like domain-containing protein n=1 Tax=Archangium violaceum TaxID=83451 RepID=UPI00193C291A|nr:carboxypeptidase regulatory-like domain-containing protein [Archangium violaceum]QRK04045.1 hypothetical protein JQX13_27610 [Archangium violaceum]
MRRRPLPLLALTTLLPFTPDCKAPTASPGGQAANTPPGVIVGTLRLSGSPPTLPPLPTIPSVASVCGTSVPDRSIVVGEGGALAYVVVALADGTEAPAPDPDAPPAQLEQKQCAFEPPVLAARAGSRLEVRNSDAVFHTVDALAGSHRPILNVALPIEGSRVRWPLPGAPGILAVRCDLHPWVSAVVRTFEHPWFTTTDASGHFRLEVPPGTHSVFLWHPRLPGVSRSISVRGGETVRLDHAWASEEVRQQSAP